MEHYLFFCMGCCCHGLAGALDYYLDMLEKIQKQVHCATGPTFADSLALQKIIVMWSVLVTSIGALLEDALLEVWWGLISKKSFS